MFQLLILIASVVFLAAVCTQIIKNQGNSNSKKALLNFASLVSGNNSDVNTAISLFLNGKQKYFRKYESDFYECGVEKPEQITKEMALIYALKSSGRLVYVDHATEADYVLTEIDKLSNGELSKHQCFGDLVNAYKESGKYNAIGNFLSNSKIAPMPFDCISSQGFRLLAINDGSDSYALILLTSDLAGEAIRNAEESGVNLYFAD